MTTSTTYPGASRPQSNNPRPVSAAHELDDPFSAANGTFRFSGRQSAASSQNRTASRTTATSASRTGVYYSRSSASGRTSAPKRTTGGSSQPPKKRKSKRKKQQRQLLLAAGFLVFAIVLLVVLLAVACSTAKNCSCKKLQSADDPQNPDPNVTGETASDPEAVETPLPSALPDISEDDIISRNVTIEGVSVQNTTVREARSRVQAKLEEKMDSLDVTVSYQSYEPVTLTADTIDLSYSADDLENALREAVNGTETALSVPLTFDGDKMREALYVLNDRIPNHAVNAKAEIKFKSKTIDGVTYQQPYWEFTNGTNGAKIDFTVLENEVRTAIESGDYTASLTPTVAVSEPEVTTEALKSQLTLLSSYQTNYATKAGEKEPELDQNNRNRDINISKAVGMMQVTVLKPGETFDFNRKTGERSEKKGWAPANAVYHGTGYRPEPGGGVCQVSTTIFNAVLRAGITSITRSGHSIPSNYVTKKFEDGLGLDATVDYGNIEFKFKNDTGHTIYMFVYITKNNSRRKNINVEIYGQKEEGVEYRVRNEILEVIPFNDETKYKYEKDKTMLETDTPKLINTPRDGYRVKTYVDKYKDGKFVKTVRTEETLYKPNYPIYRIGTAKVTPAPTNTPKPTKTPKPTATPKPENPPDEEP